LVSAPKSYASTSRTPARLRDRTAEANQKPGRRPKHLRHADIGTTTIHARLLPQELQEVVTVFDA
jgi:hypothetical protein